jgi:hypothetical protein
MEISRSMERVLVTVGVGLMLALSTVIHGGTSLERNGATLLASPPTPGCANDDCGAPPGDNRTVNDDPYGTLVYKDAPR